MIGTTVGKYRILERLGRGGMGIVYKGLDETLHREVAVKVLNPDITDSELLKRFRSEAISLARLNHPGIATIYELHQHGDELLMIMEFVRGETLQALSERVGPLGPPQAAHLCIQILNALAHAHRAGIIHRDLKPANVMVTDAGIVKIMDFGIARMLGGEQLTHAGSMMGTPAYMAPEQVLGGEIDGRADLYAVGVLLYRLLSRELPFKADTAIAMAQKQVADAPTPIRNFRPSLPPWCESLIIKALSKAPADRFQTAEAFRAAILTAVTPEALEDMPTMVTAAPDVRGAGDLTVAAQDGPGEAPTMTRAVPNTAISTAPTVSTATTSGGAPGPMTPVSGTTSPVERTGTTVAVERKHLIGVAALLVVLLGGLAVLGFALFRRTPDAGTTTATTAPAEPPAPAPASPAAPPATDPTSADGAAGGNPAQAAAVATPAPATASTLPLRGATGPGTAGRAGAGSAAQRTKPDPTKAEPPVAVAPVPSPETPPEEPPAPAPPEPPPITVQGIKVLVPQGDKLRESDAVMTLTGSELAVQSGGKDIVSVPFASISQAFYSRSKEPKWKGPDGKEQSVNVDLGRMSFFRGERNWLVITAGAQTIFVRFEDAQMRTAFASFEQRTGVKVQR